MPKIGLKKPKFQKEDKLEIAEKNTSITLKSGSETRTIKEGSPIEKRTPLNTSQIVGMNKGVTKNMGDFESLRIDCWMTDELLEGESHLDAFIRIESVIDTAIERALNNSVGE